MKNLAVALLSLSLLAPGIALADAGRAPPPMSPKAGALAAKPSPLLDVNSASVAELQALKGVGDKRAADIVKGRPYKGKDDLVTRKILPAAVYAQVKDKIVARQK